MQYPDEEELSKLKAACFRGVARVQLNALSFQHALVQQRAKKISQKNVRRIRNIFERVNCLRLQEEHFIIAVVDDASLDHAVASSRVSRSELLNLRGGQNIPYLNLRNVECLSGLHRIAAAKEFLDENDQWWIVRLFTKSTPLHVLAKILAAEQRPSDGEVFRRILLCRSRQEELSENQWWACIDNSKPKDLRQLLKNRPLAAAFESLVDMPGLWAKVQLGTLHRLLALRCDEEMIRYLKHIKKIWDLIITCGDTMVPYSAIDDTTAEKLEGLCPNHSVSDRDTVVALMKDGTIFPSVAEQHLRRALLANVLNISCLIPSLSTFFETLKFLEPPCDILRRLIGSKMKGTIRKSLFGCFFPPEKTIVQKSEKYHMEYNAQLDKAQAAEVAYVQLWAFCCRHFNELSNHAPRKGNGKDKPMVVEQNPVIWQRLATFAVDMGFLIPDATRLAMEDSRSKLALDYLKKANPLAANFSDAQIQRVVDAGSLPEDPDEEIPELNTTELEKERRYGRPFESDLKEDKHHLFVPTIYRDQDCLGVNLHFVRHDLFRSLFGSFRFQDEHLVPSILSSLERSSPAVVETKLSERRKDASSEEYTHKRRRLDDDVDRMSSEFRRLTAEVASLVREARTLHDGRPESGNKLPSPESLQEVSDDSDVDCHVIGRSEVQANSQRERLVEQQLAEQLQFEQQQAEQRFAHELEKEQAEKYWGIVLQ